MNSFSMGQLSPSHSFAQIFGTFSHATAQRFGTIAHAAGNTIQPFGTITHAATHNTRPFCKPMRQALMLSITLVFLLLSSQTLTAATPPTTQHETPPAPSGGNWSVDAHLDCALSDGGTISVVSLFDDKSGFQGFSDDYALSADRRTVTYHLSGPTSELLANTNIAILTVVDASCGGTHHYMVSTDGIGTVLILDEF